MARRWKERASSKIRGLSRRRQALPEVFASAQEFLQGLPAYVESLGPAGTGIFFGAFVLLECLSLPASPLMFSSGYLFGLPGGIAISLLALMTSAIISFGLARTLLRPQLLKLAEGNQTFEDINRAVQVEGFKIIFLLRLAPLLPFALSNYAYGLSDVKFLDFVLATMFGVVPGTCAFVYFASISKSLMSEGGQGSPWYVYAGGIVATFILLKLVKDVAEKAIADSIKKDKDGRVVN